MIGYVGLSHLGLVSSIVAASKGYKVVAYDPDSELCRCLGEEQLNVSEPGLNDLLSSHKADIKFTSDKTYLAQCQIVYISLDVPTNDEGASDLGAINRLIDDILPNLSENTCLVILSQVPPGFNSEMYESRISILKSLNISLFHQVETLVFGQAVDRSANPERIIIGSSDRTQVLPTDYAHFLATFGCPLFLMSYQSAELTKASINMFLVSSVTATNTLAEICESLGADWREIAPALKSDRRIGQYAYLAPGLGLSGGNLERDMATLSSISAKYDTHSTVIKAYMDNSLYRQSWAKRTLLNHMDIPLDVRQLAIWGLAYKPDTDSVKNSPSVHLIENLPRMNINVYDPEAKLGSELSSVAEQSNDAITACANADALVIMTPWKEFASISLDEISQSMKGNLLVDPFGVLDGENCRARGFQHYQLGVSANRQTN